MTDAYGLGRDVPIIGDRVMAHVLTSGIMHKAIPHLFPSLERSLRHTEFEEGQDLKGHQVFRVNLPIRPTRHNFHSAADGQLGGIMKVYREWRISGEKSPYLYVSKSKKEFGLLYLNLGSS